MEAPSGARLGLELCADCIVSMVQVSSVASSDEVLTSSFQCRRMSSDCRYDTEEEVGVENDKELWRNVESLRVQRQCYIL